MKIQDYLPEAGKDQFLEKIREDIERNKFLKLTDPKAFEQFLDDLILKLAKEARSEAYDLRHLEVINFYLITRRV